jgi:Ser/Thr protein kinase RdoA (MazF antagonist)
MPDAPSSVVLSHFGVTLDTPLGGRLNRHWLVKQRSARLVLRRWWQPAESVAYELDLLGKIAALGWPVAAAVAEPIEVDGRIWSLAPVLPGEPPAVTDPRAEQRARGRLLAAFHADLAQIQDVAQREPWRRCEVILADPALDRILADNERAEPELVPLLRWYLERARERVTGLGLPERPAQIVHGDFTAWNLRFEAGRLSAILDFELAHADHRVGDFALAWRGKYDDVILGYDEVAPLAPEEWALITPLWWAFLIEGACQELAAGTRDDGWLRRKLLQRSPLMGPDAAEFR